MKKVDGYRLTWLDECEFIDNSTTNYFLSLDTLFKYALDLILSTNEIDINTKEYLWENLENRELDCDCYYIEPIIFIKD